MNNKIIILVLVIFAIPKKSFAPDEETKALLWAKQAHTAYTHCIKQSNRLSPTKPSFDDVHSQEDECLKIYNATMNWIKTSHSLEQEVRDEKTREKIQENLGIKEN